VLAVLAAAGPAWAQDQQLGARAKAMGGSYTAFEDDPVLVWLNPAGIAAQPNQLAVVYQTYTAYPRSETRGPGDTIVPTVEAEAVLGDPSFWPSFIGAVFQLGTAENPMAFGLCFARPYLLNYAMDEVTTANQTTFVPEAEVEQTFTRFRVAFAKDFALRPRGEPGFLTHVAVGAAFDIGSVDWTFQGPSEERSDTSAALGGGLSVLLGLYDDAESLKINVGVAYQSAVKYKFEVETDILPAFDMPQQLNAGVTAYLLQGTPLRVTVDVQWIDWSETAEAPIYTGFRSFEDAVNVSFGLEYRLDGGGGVFLYPRLGYRRFDAPWADPDDLPMTGAYRLVLDTKDEAFDLFTFGLGVGWSDAAGRTRTIDLGADVGGDAVNVAAGVTFEF
jgi:hypothetical protein